MEDLKNATQYHLGNLINRLLIQEGFGVDYAGQFTDQAEAQGIEYCIQLLKELGVE